MLVLSSLSPSSIRHSCFFSISFILFGFVLFSFPGTHFEKVNWFRLQFPSFGFSHHTTSLTYLNRSGMFLDNFLSISSSMVFLLCVYSLEILDSRHIICAEFSQLELDCDVQSLSYRAVCSIHSIEHSLISFKMIAQWTHWAWNGQRSERKHQTNSGCIRQSKRWNIPEIAQNWIKIMKPSERITDNKFFISANRLPLSSFHYKSDPIVNSLRQTKITS